MQSKEILLFMIIITLIIFPITNLSFSQRSTDPKNNAILPSALGSNITNQNAPLNPDMMQIIVRNDTSANSNNEVQIMALYGNAITAVGAVGGGVIGSLLTYRHNRKLEQQKNLEERYLEEQRIHAQKKEENNFNARIRGIVLRELKYYSDVLSDLTADDAEKNISLLKALISYPREYPKMSLEKRATIFTAESLNEIEKAYQLFAMFSEVFNNEYRKYDDGFITFKELKDNLQSEYFKEVIDKAIESLKKEDTFQI